jgi:hypothetical protein
VPGRLFADVLHQCNVAGMSEENRKHARLMQKANRLGAQDLLEIAAMKGMTMFTNPTPDGKSSSATEPPVGCDGLAVPNKQSASSASGSVPSAAANVGDGCKTPLAHLAVSEEMEDGAEPTEPEVSD